MRKYREKKKLEGADRPELPATRAEVKEKRKKWREAKKKQLLKLTAEKKEKIKAARQRRYQEKKIAKGKSMIVPNSPQKFAAFVASLINTSSPRKQAALEKQGIQLNRTSEQVASKLSASMQDMKKSRNADTRSKLKTLVSALNTEEGKIRKMMGMR